MPPKGDANGTSAAFGYGVRMPRVAHEAACNEPDGFPSPTGPV
jgi:hypothetical protein